jgi:hypothetical protein
MPNMIVNIEVKQFRETAENRNAFIVACRSMIASLKYGDSIAINRPPTQQGNIVQSGSS